MEGEDDEVMPDITPIPPPLPMPLAALHPWGTWGSSTSSSHRLFPWNSAQGRFEERESSRYAYQQLYIRIYKGKRAHDIHCMVSINYICILAP